MLTCDGSRADAERLVEVLDGLVLAGGEDIDPHRYTRSPSIRYEDGLRGPGKRFLRPTGFAPNLQRDEFEFALYGFAKQKGIPIFGICRGMQLINVAEGGTLHEENPESAIEHFMHDDGWIPYHTVCLREGTFTRRMMEVDSYMACSLHHQSIDRLAPTLTATAVAEDGIIESLELVDDDNFILAVQGHIEQMCNNLPAYKHLLRSFFSRVQQRKMK
jgi:putative glutamine amidotransferase